MLNVKIETNPCNRKDGLHQLIIKVGTGSDRKYIRLPIFGNPNDWDKATEMFVISKRAQTLDAKVRKNQYVKNNLALGEVKQKCEDIIADFKKAKQALTSMQFVEKYVENRTNAKVGDYFDNHIKNLRETNRIGGAISNKNTVKSLRLFDPKFNKRSFADITLSFIQKFDIWLQKRGCNGNTRRHYHATFRAILNKAIKEKVATEQTYPYGKRGFNVNSLVQRTPKRYLPLDVIKTIRTTEIEDYTLELTRRIFVAQYLCYGISFIDAAYLTKTNIVTLNGGRHIVYKRKKTENSKNAIAITIKITDELQEHLTWFENNCALVGNNLFPIVSVSGYEGERLYKHIKTRLGRINKNLKKLALHFKVENMPLTSYVTRHSMAMTLRKKGVKDAVISQVMGHSDLTITQIYLDELTAEEIAGAAEALTDF